MNEEQRQKIIALRRDGAGYGSIAAKLGISINTVKSFCRRNSLTAPKKSSICEECGKPITQTLAGRGKDSARMLAGIDGGTAIWTW